jgi:hypothetical protein
MVGMMIADKISSQGFAAVMGITDINYKGLAESLYAHMIYGLKGAFNAGRYNFLNLGGSEEGSLHRFKKKFLPNHEIKMHYLKYVA